MSSSASRATSEVGTEWVEDMVRRMLPSALMKLRRTLGVKLGPRPVSSQYEPDGISSTVAEARRRRR